MFIIISLIPGKQNSHDLASCRAVDITVDNDTIIDIIRRSPNLGGRGNIDTKD